LALTNSIRLAYASSSRTTFTFTWSGKRWPLEAHDGLTVPATWQFSSRMRPGHNVQSLAGDFFAPMKLAPDPDAGLALNAAPLSIRSRGAESSHAFSTVILELEY